MFYLKRGAKDYTRSRILPQVPCVTTPWRMLPKQEAIFASQDPDLTMLDGKKNDTALAVSEGNCGGAKSNSGVPHTPFIYGIREA